MTYKLVLKSGFEATYQKAEELYDLEKDNGWQIWFSAGHIMPIYKGDDTIGVIVLMDN